MIHLGSKIAGEVFSKAALRLLICLKHAFSRIRLALAGSRMGTRRDVPPKPTSPASLPALRVKQGELARNVSLAGGSVKDKHMEVNADVSAIKHPAAFPASAFKSCPRTR